MIKITNIQSFEPHLNCGPKIQSFNHCEPASHKGKQKSEFLAIIKFLTKILNFDCSAPWNEKTCQFSEFISRGEIVGQKFQVIDHCEPASHKVRQN